MSGTASTSIHSSCVPELCEDASVPSLLTVERGLELESLGLKPAMVRAAPLSVLSRSSGSSSGYRVSGDDTRVK